MDRADFHREFVCGLGVVRPRILTLSPSGVSPDRVTARESVE